jgi:hypothetical protein
MIVVRRFVVLTLREMRRLTEVSRASAAMVLAYLHREVRGISLR